MPASVDSKPLTETLSPLDATLMKNIGGWPLLWLTRHPMKGVCPERPSGVKDLYSALFTPSWSPSS